MSVCYYEYWMSLLPHPLVINANITFNWIKNYFFLPQVILWRFTTLIIIPRAIRNIATRFHKNGDKFHVWMSWQQWQEKGGCLIKCVYNRECSYKKRPARALANYDNGTSRHCILQSFYSSFHCTIFFLLPLLIRLKIASIFLSYSQSKLSNLVCRLLRPLNFDCKTLIFQGSHAFPFFHSNDNKRAY